MLVNFLLDERGVGSWTASRRLESVRRRRFPATVYWTAPMLSSLRGCPAAP
jgi:hypothetical protein